MRGARVGTRGLQWHSGRIALTERRNRFDIPGVRTVDGFRMSTPLENIDTDLATWLRNQPVFFVSTAPLSQTGHINCSPKGGDTFRVLGPMSVGYLDYTGSGAETLAHLRENGRIVLMFCAFQGSPRIIRLHGSGRYLRTETPEFAELAGSFDPVRPGARGVVQVAVRRVSKSCGYSVPRMRFESHRTTLDEWCAGKGPEELSRYRETRNARSIDGLPAWK